MTDTLRLDATIDLQAADGKRQPQITILAYSGGLMKVAPFGPLAIDLAALETPSTVALLAEHQESLSGVIGSGTPSRDGSRLTVTGKLADTPPAQQIVALSKAGVPLGASVGVEILSQQTIRAGENVTVNGQSLTAPSGGMLLVSRGRLREVSVVVNGADHTAAVSIAAKSAGARTMSDESQESVTAVQAGAPVMRPEVARWVKAMLPGIDVNTLPPAEMTALTMQYDGVNVSSTNLQAAHHAERVNSFEERIPMAKTVPGSSLRASAPGRITADTVSAALLVKAGQDEAAGRIYGDQIASAGRGLRARSTTDILATALQHAGIETSGMTQDGIIRASGWSPVNLPNILGDSLGKLLLDRYRQAPSPWQLFAKKVSAPNFLSQSALRPTMTGGLDQLGAGGQITHAGVVEGEYTWQLATYAKMLRVTRQDLVNDNLSVFAELPGMMQDAAQRKLADLIWTAIFAGVASNHYSSGNGNYNTTGSALAIGTVGSAVKQLRQMVDSDGMPISIEPKVLAVAPALEMTAKAIVSSAEILGTSGPNGNPLQNALVVVTEPRLSNSNFTGYSDTRWLLLGAPEAAGVLVGFLNNQEAPTVEVLPMTAEADTLGVTIRCYVDYAAALGDPKASIYNTGSA